MVNIGTSPNDGTGDALRVAFNKVNTALMPYGSEGNTARSLPERFTEWLNVRDFGAKGDGVTNDTAAIQGAINAAIICGIPAKGAGVFLPPGRYLHTGLTITRPVFIQGCGLTGNIVEYSVWSGSELIYNGTGTAITIAGDVNSNFCHRVFLQDFAITSTGSAAIGLSVTRCEECDFTRIRIGGVNSNGFSQYGIYAQHFSLSTIHKCVIQGHGTGAFFDWNTGGCSRLTISDCNFYWNTNHIKLSGGSSINIEKNQMERCHYGILIDNVNAQNKVQLDTLRIFDNLFNNGDGTQPVANSRFVKANATADVQFYLQRVSITGNTLFMDSAALYGIEFTVTTPATGGHFNLSVTEMLITGNLARTATTAFLRSDTDFIPAVLWNDFTGIPALMSGVHTQLTVRGHVAEARIGDTDANSSIIRLLSSAGNGSTPNYLQVGRDGTDSAATLVECRTSTEGSPLNFSAKTSYIDFVEFKGSVGIDGILNMNPPTNGGVAYVLVNPASGAKMFQLSAGTFNSPTNLDLIKLYGLLHLTNAPSYANNAAALTGGLVAGQVYRNGDALQIVH